MTDLRTGRRKATRTLVWYWLPLLAWMGMIFYLSSQPDLPGPPEPWLVELVSIVAHFALYAVLAFLWWRALSRGRKTDRAILGLAFVFAVLYGLTDEYHQSFVPGRDASLLDILTDAFGAVVAIGVIWFHKVR